MFAVARWGALIGSLAIVAAACAPATSAPAAPSGGPQGAAPAATLEQARADAKARGLLFAASHDEIVAKAKEEGQLRVLLSMEKEAIQAVKDGFGKLYPFIKLEAKETSGSEAQRFLLELQTGTATGWDSIHIAEELYRDHLPHLEKIDLLGMAQQKVLNITPKMVDPNNRSIMAAGSAIAGFSYNKKLLSPEKAPKRWEDFLAPELKGRKFIVDIEPTNLATLWPLKGEEWVLDYAKKLLAQQPIWARGESRAITAMAAGEYMLHFASNYHSSMRVKGRVPDAIDVTVLDPVPVRLAEYMAVAKGAKHPYSSLLLYEFLAGPEGQRILDELGPLQSSIYAPGSKLEQAIKGKQVSVMDWDHIDKLAGYMQKIVAAWGFPKAETR